LLRPSTFGGLGLVYLILGNSHKVRPPHRRGRAGAAGGQASPPDGPAREKRAAQLLESDALATLPFATPVWPSVATAPGGLRRGQRLRTPRRGAAARDLIFASRRPRAFGRVSTERARRGSPTGSSDGTLSWAIAAAPFARKRQNMKLKTGPSFVQKGSLRSACARSCRRRALRTDPWVTAAARGVFKAREAAGR